MLSTLALVEDLGAHLNTDAGVVALIGEDTVFHATVDRDQPTPFLLFSFPRIDLRDAQGYGPDQASGQSRSPRSLSGSSTKRTTLQVSETWPTRPTPHYAHGHQATGPCASFKPWKSGPPVSKRKGKPFSPRACSIA